MIPDVIMS